MKPETKPKVKFPVREAKLVLVIAFIVVAWHSTKYSFGSTFDAREEMGNVISHPVVPTVDSSDAFEDLNLDSVNYVDGGVSIKNVRPPKSPAHILWVGMFYHKSGNRLSSYLFRPFNRRNILKLSGYIRHTTVGNSELSKLAHSGNYIRFGGVDYNHTYINELNPHYRLVHFTRDPFDMVLSGFRYHFKPCPEAWCKSDTWYRRNWMCPKFENWVHQHKHSARLVGFERDDIDELLLLCNSLYDLSKKLGAKTYSDSLYNMYHTGKVKEAIWYEALRTLVQHNSDLLAMGRDSVQGSQHQQTLRIFMRDLTASSYLFNRNAACIVQFLQVKELGINQLDIVKDMSELADLHVRPKEELPVHHVTANKLTISKEETLRLLKSHPTINKVLTQVSNKIYHKGKAHFCAYHVDDFVQT